MVVLLCGVVALLPCSGMLSKGGGTAMEAVRETAAASSSTTTELLSRGGVAMSMSSGWARK